MISFWVSISDYQSHVQTACVTAWTVSPKILGFEKEFKMNQIHLQSEPSQCV